MNIDIYAEDPEVTLDYMLAVMQAAKEGKPVQQRQTLHQKWGHNGVPSWDWNNFRYRINPDSRPKKRVPLTADDIPAVCWLRGSGPAFLVISIGEAGVFVTGVAKINPVFLPFTELAQDWTYSTDRKTWLPCWKEVAE